MQIHNVNQYVHINQYVHKLMMSINMYIYVYIYTDRYGVIHLQ